MKTRVTLLALLILVSASIIHSQGPLTPPGAPAPMMKTLAQIEPRIPISVVPYNIVLSGSYYLTNNVSVGTAGGNAITINASEVTVDLNGTTIFSPVSPAGGTAVLINGTRQNVTLKNGNLRGTTFFIEDGAIFGAGGFLNGVLATSTACSNIRIADVNVSGVAGDGINLLTTNTASLVVERCNLTICGGQGIQAGVVRDCTVQTAGSNGIVADIVTNSSGATVNTADALAVGVYGISIVENCRGIASSRYGVRGGNVSNSRGTSNTFTGLLANTATNCSGISTTWNGIEATNAINCEGTSTGRYGILASMVTNCDGSSTSSFGILVSNATNSRGSSSSGVGLGATNATNCYGSSSTGPAGIDVNPGTASFCHGQRNGGIAIDATTAIGCTVSLGTVNAVNKFLGTP